MFNGTQVVSCSDTIVELSVLFLIRLPLVSVFRARFSCAVLSLLQFEHELTLLEKEQSPEDLKRFTEEIRRDILK